MVYRIGIDTGSKTVKIVVLGADDSVVYSRYCRHRSNIVSTLESLLSDLAWKMREDVEGSFTITGSAGIGVAKVLGIPFEQEVIATTHAIRETIPDADAVVELGGEDAKVTYLSGGLEQRMNATCAGGTGGFIDTIAFMIGAKPADMSDLAFASTRRYPIASRCAVFAQTDVRPLLNAGVSKQDIAASALDAVVKQTLGGLACGRPLRGKVIFLGGPIEHIPYLLEEYRRSLCLDPRFGIKPRDAHLYTALGAALLSASEGLCSMRVSDLAKKLRTIDRMDDDLPRLPPLFNDGAELETFKARHSIVGFPRARLFDAKGPLYVGIDAGSTTVKIAVLNNSGMMVHNAYRPTKGDVLGTLRSILLELYGSIPHSCGKEKEAYAWISHATVTGYGEDLIRAVFGADSGVVETAAHLRAAKELCPDVSFILDVGGQDVKAIWVREGQIADAVLNEACSSGCGSFVEGAAYSLGSNSGDFSEAALRSDSPLDLGAKCTVFMTSRVRHAQKIGAPISDIAAGVAYSVVRNALFRIIGADRLFSIGNRVVLQGGAFKSDAVLRAFELVSGCEATRYEHSHLMGAIGAALVARDRSCIDLSTEVEHISDALLADWGKGDARVTKSGLVSKESLLDLKTTRRSFICSGCGNSCALSLVALGEGRSFVTGGRCGRNATGLERREEASRTGRFVLEKDNPPNVIGLGQKIIASYGDVECVGERSGIKLGIVSSLGVYMQIPFWHRFFTALGFDVLIPRDDVSASLSEDGRAWETVPSESVCFPAKISHIKYFDLVHRKADIVFMPKFNCCGRCPVMCGYAEALFDNLTDDLPPLAMPLLASEDCEEWVNDSLSRAALRKVVSDLAQQAGLGLRSGEFSLAIDAALEEQRSFDARLQAETSRALKWISSRDERRGIVVSGRPYHLDPSLLRGIDRQLGELGFAVMGVEGLRDSFAGASVDLGETDVEEPMSDDGHIAASLFALGVEKVDVVFLQSFGCGYEAVPLQAAQELLNQAGSLHALLKIDEMTDLSHIRIRLRTLAAAVEARELAHENTKMGRRASPGCSFVSKGAKNNGMEVAVSSDVAVFGRKEGRRGGFVSVSSAKESPESVECDATLFFDLDGRDIGESRRLGVKDACSTTNVMASWIARLIREHPGISEVRIPRVCEGCVMAHLEYMVRRMANSEVRIIWGDPKSCEAVRNGVGKLPRSTNPACSQSNDLTSAESMDVEKDSIEAKPRFGLLGNALMCFNSSMNDGLVEKLESLGCDVVLPEPRLISVDDVSYKAQLELYEAKGVHDVIYVQSFGCLKGHVRAKGALHELNKVFPSIRITVIDYDYEASALNRENRIRLAVRAAQLHGCAYRSRHKTD